MAKTQTQEKQQQTQGPQGQAATNMTKPKEEVAQFYAPRLLHHPYIEKEYGIDKAKWKALVEAIFPNATTSDAVLLALSYCKARGLDIFKRPVHIVAIWSKAEKRMIDSVWPGIGELRATAHRTNEYAGHDETVVGPTIEARVGGTLMKYPEWMRMTVYRFVQGARCAFPGPKVYWLETYATAGKDSDDPNEMWRNRPNGQLEKCAEAAALRSAFPEELGGEYIPEEIERGATYGAVTQSPIAAAVGMSKAESLTQRLQESQVRDAEVVEAKRELAHEPERDPGDEPNDKPPTAEQIRAKLNVSTTLEQIADVEALIGKFEPADARDSLWQDVSKRKVEVEKMQAQPKGQLPLT